MRRVVFGPLVIFLALCGCEPDADVPVQPRPSAGGPAATSQDVAGAPGPGQQPATQAATESVDPKDWKKSYAALLANFKVLPGRGEDGKDAIDYGPFQSVRNRYGKLIEIKKLREEAEKTKKLNVTQLAKLEKEYDETFAIDTQFEWEATFLEVKQASGSGWQAIFDWPPPPGPLVVEAVIVGDRMKWFDLKRGQKVRFKGTFTFQFFLTDSICKSN